MKKDKSRIEENMTKGIFQDRLKRANQRVTKKKEISAFLERKLRSSRGIRSKILFTTFIPILLMILFGIVCYVRTARAITANYEKSTVDTINAVGDYLGLGLESVQNKSIELVFSNSVTDYYNRNNATVTLDDIKKYNKLKDEVVVMQTMNPFIGNITLFGKYGKTISTAASNNMNDQMYLDFNNSIAANKMEEVKNGGLWMGKHSNLDELLGTDGENYSASYLACMGSGEGYIVIDISKDTIKESLSKINYGKGSVLGFVSADGKETLSNTDNATVFSNLKYYLEAASGDKLVGQSYQAYNGTEYLYVFTKVGETGCMICALIPKSTILKQTDSIKLLIVLFIIIAAVIAFILGTIIARGIGNAIVTLVQNISRVAKGDLTVKFETKRKDEFLMLSKSLNEMIGSMESLIREVAVVGYKVNGSAILLSSVSETILAGAKDIGLTIDEIGKGIVQQADDTQNCSDQMCQLSDKISQLDSSTGEIDLIAKDTKMIVGNGILIVDELKNKTQDTCDITEAVIKNIEELEEQSNGIAKFVGIINEIAVQTNLLSLNASIEASRAGHAGRGFAVVAAEIRKLADESVKAAKEIKSIVTNIEEKTQNTVDTTKKAKNIVLSQTQALNRSVDLFENIDQHVVELIRNLQTITTGIKGIDSAKQGTMEAISNISAISQETAASSEEVNETVNNQVLLVERLSQSAGELAGDAVRLKVAIQVFRISE